MSFQRTGGRAADALRPGRADAPLHPPCRGLGPRRVRRHRRCCAPRRSTSACPRHKRGSGEGWVMAEYGMLPRSTHHPQRLARRRAASRAVARRRSSASSAARCAASSISRPWASARSILDCDVLQADGGTRTAAITGAYVACARRGGLAARAGRRIPATPIRDFVAAVSVGVVGGTPLLDLEYVEDAACGTDMNVVMTASGGFVEVQGTAEGAPFTRAEMDLLLGLADAGIRRPRSSPAPSARRRSPHEGLVLASNNAKKLVELRALFAGIGVELVAQGELGIGEAEEPHVTFVENALAKARHAAAAASGAAIADDSGLVVDALGGAPGVQSAVWAPAPAASSADREANAPSAGRRQQRAAAGTARRRRRPPRRVRQHAGRAAPRPRPAAADRRSAAGPAASPTARQGSGGFGYDPLMVVDDARRQQRRGARPRRRRTRTATAPAPPRRCARRCATPGTLADGRRPVGQAGRGRGSPRCRRSRCTSICRGARRSARTATSTPMNARRELPEARYIDAAALPTSKRSLPLVWGRACRQRLRRGGGTPSLFDAGVDRPPARRCPRFRLPLEPPAARSRPRRTRAPSSASASAPSAARASPGCRSACRASTTPRCRRSGASTTPPRRTPRWPRRRRRSTPSTST